MWIDTHCHLDADEFDADRDAVVARARAAGVTMQVLPAAHVSHFAKTAAVARQYGLAYALGIHPLWVGQSDEADIERLREAARAALADPRFVAIGEIGLDFYVEGLDRERQHWFYREQLKIAREFGLPAILHVRRSADALLRELGHIEIPGGIAHAFNGSEDQAGRFVARGFKLGFGGAMTYDGSLRIRRHAATLPDTGWVLETDSPDIPPQWCRDGRTVLRNEPCELPRMAEVMARLRRVELETLARQNEVNARSALPRLGAWLDPVAAFTPPPQLSPASQGRESFPSPPAGEGSKPSPASAGEGGCEAAG
ncbi:MAG: TatD family hydrolase [Betaproteobacteria bacterium]